MDMKNKTLTIGQRLTLKAVAVISIFLISIFLSLWQIHKLNNTVDELTSKQIPFMQTSMLLLSNINDVSSTLRGFFLTHDINFLQKNTTTWQSDIIPAMILLQNIAKQTSSQSDRKAINNIVELISQIKDKSDKIKSTNDTNQAIKLLQEELTPQTRQLKLAISTMIGMQDTIIQKQIATTKQKIAYFTMLEWVLLILGSSLSALLAYRISRSIVRPVNEVVDLMNHVAEGRAYQIKKVYGPQEIQHLSKTASYLVDTLDKLTQAMTHVADQHYDVRMEPRSNDDKMILALNKMTDALKENKIYYDDQLWLQKGINALADSIAKSNCLEHLCTQALSEICRHMDAGIGAFYLHNDDNKMLNLIATYAFVERDGLSSQYAYGEGVVGQVAREQKPILLKQITRQEMVIQSGVTAEAPLTTYTFPLLDKNDLIAVIEIGFHEVITPIKMSFTEKISSTLASSVRILDQKQITESLLEKQKALSEELVQQQEELKTSNEELETQAEELRTSEEELRVRDEEQRSLNQTLEERNRILEQQKIEIETAREEVTRRAEELASASKYKSEFLANMSHELRTPLNSILLLSRMLSDEKQSKLDDENRESVQVIHKSAEDLLHLINDILDLSKVEAGKIKVESEELQLTKLSEELVKDFKHIAQDKGLSFNIVIDKNSPHRVITDGQRLKQIIKNLLSNAFKFTEKGTVELIFGRPSPNVKLLACQVKPSEILAVTVRDTGIGIPKNKHQEIFKTFYQCDGATNRNYAGTGLGLSISLQLAALLGGEIQVDSEEGAGSSFYLYIPEVIAVDMQKSVEDKTPEQGALIDKLPMTISVDTPALAIAGDNVLLIVEDDPQFANILKTTCEKKGFKCLWAKNGEEALLMAKNTVLLGILMDMNLPDETGLSVVDKLKADEHTKDIPVHFISGADKEEEAMQHGAVSYIMKPITIEKLDSTIKTIEKMVNSKLMNLLVVEDDTKLRNVINKIFTDKNVKVTGTALGKKAIEMIKKHQYDCFILDLHLADISGFEVLETLNKENIAVPPVIVYTGKELTEEEVALLESYSKNIIIKGKASLDRLKDETLLFIHYLSKKHESIAMVTGTVENIADDKRLHGKKILLVDDDVRNAFSLAKTLKMYGATILIAPNGKLAIDTLNQDHEVALVLMDIMMPVMDGFEAIKRIRANNQFASLPIIALTAKAMAQDREQSLAVGATDYLAKPVDIDKLLILLRAWV